MLEFDPHSRLLAGAQEIQSKSSSSVLDGFEMLRVEKLTRAVNEERPTVLVGGENTPHFPYQARAKS